MAGTIIVGLSEILTMYGPALLSVAGFLPDSANGSSVDALKAGGFLAMLVALFGHLSFLSSLPFALPYTYLVFNVSLFELARKPIWTTCSDLPDDMRDQ
ncbi:hypothetical protein [Hyphomonas sp.]|uniref:hypothetical protein n=1 Tax=Hyphomonas sp. TaxID=87 RepID=UPI0039E286CB